MAEQGFEPALAAGGLGGYAALGICLAVAVFAKNSGDKATAGSAAFTNALCGITEPGLYGIILRSKWLLGTMVFSGAAAGLVFGIGGVAATNFAFTGILAFSGWLGCVNFPMYCVGIVVAIALGFGITAFLLKSGKVKEYNFHVLRHTFATNCIEVGMDIKSLSEILGHATVDITLNRYVHSSRKMKEKYLEKL